MIIRAILCLTILCSLGISAQSQLMPLLNSGVLPADQDTIQNYSYYIDSTDNFVAGGYQVGDPVADFIVYDTASLPVQLSQLLADGKPVLLVSGSRSCPAYRKCATIVLPELYTLYGAYVHFLVVYQMEAHPIGPFYSPFSDTVNTTATNVAANVLIPQHITYADRKQRAIEQLHTQTFSCPMALDGPGNEFWQAYGPSPNNGYLITAQGIVYAKYGWMHLNKLQAIQDIQSLLGINGSIETLDSNSDLVSLQNPGNDQTMLYNNSSDNMRLEVFDLNGRLVVNKVLDSESDFALGAALHEPGLYVIYASVANRNQIVRFAKY